MFDGEKVSYFEGAERAWKFTVKSGVRLPSSLPLEWAFGTYSPNTLITGTWEEAAAVQIAEALRNELRKCRLVKTKAASSDIRSLYLQLVEGSGVISPLPG